MKKLNALKFAVLISTGLSLLFVSPGWGNTISHKLLRDGFALAGVDGTFMGPDENGKWFFKSLDDIADDKGIIQAGEPVELLTSSVFEKLLIDSNETAGGNYRLWGRVTTFKDKNYIFASYFLPVEKAEANEPTEEQNQIRANAPDDAVKLPDDVLAMLRPKRVVSLAALKKSLRSKKDFMLVDRAGFVVKDSDSNDYYFKIDSIGRNTSDISFKLMPCEAIERAIRENQRSLNMVRFSATGIMTAYKGRHYMLIQRLRKQYNYGNFAR